MKAKPGDTRQLSYQVTNNLAESINVRLQVRQFRVDPETRELTFSTPKYNWVEADTETLALAPNDRKSAQFQVTLPADAASQEYHYALLTSTDITSGDTTKRLQVAPLFYLYVEGKPIDRTSRITADTRLGITMSNSIPYSFEVQNDGNIHLESRVSARLDGPKWHLESDTLRKLVLPNQSRSTSGRLAAPYLPGIYTLTYASTDDVSGDTIQTTRPFIFIPPWSVAATILLVLICIWGWQLLRRNRS